MTMPTILVADDEPDVLETLSYRLSREGYSVVTATDGVEALGAARAHQPDLALLDVMMPRENGYRVARTLREDERRGVYPHGLKIALLTARDLSGEPDREEIFLEFSRADLMLYKPFDLEELVARVGDVLLGDAAVLPRDESAQLAC